MEPNRTTDHSETLIDNILSIVITVDAVSGNLTSTISDHLLQIMIAPNVFANCPSNKSNIYEREWSNIDQVNFVLDRYASFKKIGKYKLELKTKP